MEKTLINCQQTFVADHQTTEITQPGEGSLDYPVTFVTRPHFIRLFSFIFSIPSERHKQTYTPTSKLVAQFVRIVGFISVQVLRSSFGPTSSLSRNFDRLKGFFNQCYFRWRCRGNGASQRNTLAVDHHQPLRALPPFSFPDGGAPFFAGAKLASMKASCQSSTPSVANWDRKVLQTCNQIPSSVQRLRRRQQIDGLGYPAKIALKSMGYLVRCCCNSTIN